MTAKEFINPKKAFLRGLYYEIGMFMFSLGIILTGTILYGFEAIYNYKGDTTGATIFVIIVLLLIRLLVSGYILRIANNLVDGKNIFG